jgi:hypothetical protein
MLFTKPPYLHKEKYLIFCFLKNIEYNIYLTSNHQLQLNNVMSMLQHWPLHGRRLQADDRSTMTTKRFQAYIFILAVRTQSKQYW